MRPTALLLPRASARRRATRAVRPWFIEPITSPLATDRRTPFAERNAHTRPIARVDRENDSVGALVATRPVQAAVHHARSRLPRDSDGSLRRLATRPEGTGRRP